jgi:hypothetical protein
MRSLLLLLLVIHLAASGADAQAVEVSPVGVKVTGYAAFAYGYRIHVTVTNRSKRRLYLPQSPYWEDQHPLPPKIASLGVSQWLNGKTNMLAAGRSFEANSPAEPGYYSVGPCHDLPFDNKWITLAPGESLDDVIEAFEPGEGYISAVCPWRHAHVGGRLQISVSAFAGRGLRAKKWAATSGPFEVAMFRKVLPQ